MSGCRNLSNAEIQALTEGMTSRYALRDRALLILGIYTGYRISEMLSLIVADVWDGERVRDHVTVSRSAMKGKKRSRGCPLNPKAKEALLAWIDASSLKPSDPLFLGQKGKAISRQQAARILAKAKDLAGIKEAKRRLGWHCTRKTFGKKVYDATGKDLIKTGKALGHANINNTIRYLPGEDEGTDDIIRGL